MKEQGPGATHIEEEEEEERTCKTFTNSVLQQKILRLNEEHGMGEQEERSSIEFKLYFRDLLICQMLHQPSKCQ